MHISFHSEAGKRFNQLATQLLETVCEVAESRVSQHRDLSLYPAASLQREDLMGGVRVTPQLLNSRGEEIGKVWHRGGRSFGVVGDAYQELMALAQRIEKSVTLNGRVRLQFLIDEIALWLETASASQATKPLTEYIAARCEQEIHHYEIWIPLHRVYSSAEFSIGDVLFKSIGGTMMEVFFDERSKPGKPQLSDAQRQRLKSLRSQLQGGLAACVRIEAERETARQAARLRADRSIALLRFLSEANWSCGVRSYCLPLGREQIEIGTELFVADGRITSIAKTSLERGQVFWDIDEARPRFSGLIEALDSLASNTTSEFRRQVYNALLLYSRNSVASEVADKLVFVLVALESVLLRDASEPIAKNIGERLAFLVGSSIGERKAIVKNVDQTYRIRSGFVHHGSPIEDIQTIEQFLAYAWRGFRIMLGQLDTVSSKAELIEQLEDRKMT